MKILHLLQSSRFSGAENVVCQIIGMMSDEPNIEMVYCSPDGQIRDALFEQGIRFVALKRFSIKELKRTLKIEKPDVIYAHDMYASFIAALVCGRMTLVSHIHNNAFNSRGISIKSLAYLLAAVKAHHIFWVSKSAFDGYVFHKWFKKKSTTLYNILDVDVLYTRMKNDCSNYCYDIVYVGRLSYPKNPQRLMQVLAYVINKNSNVKIAIVGTGELENEVKATCNELSLNGNVEFLGFQSNPLKIMHDSKVMVMTSRWEGTPMVALEAQALGVPIVSTPVDGLKDIIVDGKNGYLSDDNETIAHHLLEIVSDEELRRRLSKYSIQESNLYNDKKAYKDNLLKVIKK